MPYNEAAEYFEKIHSIHATQFYKALSRYAGRSFTISWVNSIETLEDIRKELAKQTKEKLDPVELKKLINQVIESRGETPLKPSHLANVVRTNVQTAFSKGRMETQIEAGKEFWQYLTVMDGRETELCHTLNTKIFKSSDPFWKQYYPPNHYQCRSTVIAIDPDELDPDETPEADGLDYLKKSDLKNIKPGRGFQYSPLNALDKHINQKCKEHKIDPVESKTPATNNTVDKEFLLKQHFNNPSLKEFNQVMIDTFKNSPDDIFNLVLKATPCSNISWKTTNRSFFRPPSQISIGVNQVNSTVVHEYAHYLDHHLGKLSLNKLFNDAIDKDKSIYFTRKKSEKSKSNQQIIELTNLFKDLHTQNKNNNYSYDRERLIGRLEDLFEGLSKCKILTRYGHGKDYWKYPGNINAEIFAQVLTLKTYKEDDLIKILEKYAPNILTAFDKIIIIN